MDLYGGGENWFMRLKTLCDFGNALDNAIAAVGKLQDREKRVISTK